MATRLFNEQVETWQNMQLNNYLNQERKIPEMVLITCPFCDTPFEREKDNNDEYVCFKCGEIVGENMNLELVLDALVAIEQAFMRQGMYGKAAETREQILRVEKQKGEAL